MYQNMYEINNVHYAHIPFFILTSQAYAYAGFILISLAIYIVLADINIVLAAILFMYSFVCFILSAVSQIYHYTRNYNNKGLENEDEDDA